MPVLGVRFTITVGVAIGRLLAGAVPDAVGLELRAALTGRAGLFSDSAGQAAR